MILTNKKLARQITLEDYVSTVTNLVHYESMKFPHTEKFPPPYKEVAPSTSSSQCFFYSSSHRYVIRHLFFGLCKKQDMLFEAKSLFDATFD